jgi:hypothetical protein
MAVTGGDLAQRLADGAGLPVVDHRHVAGSVGHAVGQRALQESRFASLLWAAVQRDR